MWILEDNIYGNWSELLRFDTEQLAQLVLAQFALNTHYSNYQFRIVYKPNN